MACAALRYKGQYLLIRRSPDDPKSTRFGQHTLWHRCHVETRHNEPLLECARAQLSERVRDDLHLSQLGNLELLGGIWIANEGAANHLGIAFVIDIANEDAAESLSDKKFRRGERAPILRTAFYTLEELRARQDLETWSQAAVTHLLEP